MILKALYDYYSRDSESIPYGWQLQAISFNIVIDYNGTFKYIEDCRQGNQGTFFLVPKGSHNNGISPLLFWDNLMYLLDYIPEDEISNPNDKQKSTIQKARNKHLSFVERCTRVAEATNDEELLAVGNFYKLGEIKKVYNDKLWEFVKTRSSVWLSFRIIGENHIVAENNILKNYNSIIDSEESHTGICLITGHNSEIVRLCTDTPIVGSKNSAKLVSFNDSSYCSYNKEQGENSPISKEAEFAFSSSLKKLISKDSRNKFLIGNRTFVFWASKNDEVGKQTEECIWDMFGFNDSNDDDPNHGIEQVRKVFKAIYSGSFQTTMDDKFYILGLAPNIARIAVTYCAEIPLKVFAERINNHFDNMEIVDNERKIPKPYMGLCSILSSIALDGKIYGKDSKLTPNLPEAVVKSIFQGLPYPYTLFVACIHRIRAEQQVPKEHKEKMKWLDTMVCRIAIIKAYLNRLNNNEQKIGIMLDKENKNQGYLCGRLFAVLDRKQEKARNQRSIRERYMNSASSTPSIVFPTILNLSRHHEKELKDDKERIWFEKLEQDIMKRISADGFPAHLDLQDQGRFFVGYYHQRQDFFEKKTANNENE